MPFIELEFGEEILLEVDDIPEPPASTFTDNPYEAGTTRFKRWRATAKARYTKACYKAVVDAKNTADFLAKVGSAKAILQDPTAWDNYKSCRGFDEYRRPVGRPKLSDEEKVKRAPRKKRSDAMKSLLEENGYRIVDDMVLDARSNELGTFMPNGKVELKDGSRVSVHAFLNQ